MKYALLLALFSLTGNIPVLFLVASLCLICWDICYLFCFILEATCYVLVECRVLHELDELSWHRARPAKYCTAAHLKILLERHSYCYVSL